jgi:hypothetical protein
MSESILTFSEDITNAPPPPLLPAGPYPAEIIGAVRKTSATSKKDYAQITFRINAESYRADDTDSDPDGTVITYNFLQMSDTPQNRHRWRVFLEKIGGRLGRTIDLNALIGLTATVDVTHQAPNEFRDEPSVQISRILAA